jgi:hypothetical protein
MDQQQQQRRQQQEPQQPIHSAVLNGIACLEDPRFRKERHKLIVRRSYVPAWCYLPPIDQQSLQHLVAFLENGDSHEVIITELELNNVDLVFDPSPDGGLNVLRDLFARSDATLKKSTIGVLLAQQEPRRCLSSFGSLSDQQNRLRFDYSG